MARAARVEDEASSAAILAEHEAARQLPLQ
jgi:hypothetical protein